MLSFFGIIAHVSILYFGLFWNLHYNGFADIFHFGAPPPGGRKLMILLLSSLTSFLLNRILLTPAVILCNIPVWRACLL
jgi:hypothetical protein